MRPIPPPQREAMEQMPFFRVCALAAVPGHECEGRITWDHPLTYGGPQLIEQNWTVPLCASAHNVDYYQDAKTYKQEMSIWVALGRSTNEQILSISKANNYTRDKARLTEKYGVYDENEAIRVYLEKHPPLIPGYASIPGPTKKNWHCVTDEQKRLIEEVIKFHRDVDGRRYTQQQIIEKMVKEYHQEVITMIQDLGSES